MTQHSARGQTRPLTIGGTVLHRSLTRERHRLARRLVELFAENIPQYQRLPGEELAEDILTVTEHNLVAIAEALRTRTVPDVGDLAGPITASAARRADEGMPLEALMSAYGLGLAEVWRVLTAGAGPEDVEDLVACTNVIFGYVQRVTTAVSAAYVEERHRMFGQEQDRRYALLSALLGGDSVEAVEDLAMLAGVQLPPAFLVLSLDIGRHRDETDPAVSGAIATRRKLHRVQAELEEFSSDLTLALLDATGGTALLPAEPEPEPVPGPVPVPVSTTVTTPKWAGLRDLIARMERRTGVSVTAAVARATRAEVSDAAEQTRELLGLVRAFGRGPGLYDLGDLLVEYQLTRPSAATEHMRALLDPLDEHPDLLTTMQAYLEHGLNRRRTASALHLHANTIDYRLRRAVQLTGLDPADPVHLQRIAAALAVRRMR